MIEPIIDFAIITALPIEREAVCKEFKIDYEKDCHNPSQGFRDRYWQKRFYDTQDQNKFYEIAVFQLSEPGNVSACQLTTRILDTFNPQVVLLVGIAAGIDKTSQNFGDIVVAKEIAYLEKGKDTAKGRKPEPVLRPIYCDDWDERNPSFSRSFIPSISTPRPDHLDTKPEINYGIIVASDTVVASERVREQLIKENRRIIAIEMEGYGFDYAISQCDRNIQRKRLIIKAISDFANDEKDDKWHKYAAASAANYTKHFVIHFKPDKKTPKHRIISRIEESDSTYFRNIQKSLEKGNLMFFLGSGINSGKDDRFPPSDRQIIRELFSNNTNQLPNLVKLIGFPCETCAIELDDRPEYLCPIRREILEQGKEKSQLIQEQELAFAKLALQCLTQNYLITNPEYLLVKHLRVLFSKRTEPNEIQTNIAKFAAECRDRDYQYPLILTTNYDIGLEKAFEATGIDIEVLSYIAKGKHYGKFQRISYESVYNKKNNKQFYEVKNKFSLDNNEESKTSNLPIGEKPIIFKLYGGYIYKARQYYEIKKEDGTESKDETNKLMQENYSFAVTESHHVNYYKNIRQEKRFLIDIKNRFKKNRDNILFLGYSASDEFLRSFLDNFCSERWNDNTDDDNTDDAASGWIVQQSAPGPLSDKEYWEHWNIKFINYSWQDFVRVLKNDYLHIK